MSQAEVAGYSPSSPNLTRGPGGWLGLRLPITPPRAFLTAALAQGLCEVLLVVTKEVEEKGCWLHSD